MLHSLADWWHLSTFTPSFHPIGEAFPCLSPTGSCAPHVIVLTFWWDCYQRHHNANCCSLDAFTLLFSEYLCFVSLLRFRLLESESVPLDMNLQRLILCLVFRQWSIHNYNNWYFWINNSLTVGTMYPTSLTSPTGFGTVMLLLLLFTC